MMALTRDTERGSGTVLGLAVLGVLFSLLVSLLMLGAAVLARHHAQTAADLGAVAGAQVLKSGRGTDAACARAAQVVVVNGAKMDECAVVLPSLPDHGGQVRLRVHRDVAVGPGWVADGVATAGLVQVDR